MVLAVDFLFFPEGWGALIGGEDIAIGAHASSLVVLILNPLH